MSERTTTDADFAEWFARECPPGTIISNPAWWAPRILRRARDAAPAAPPASPGPEPLTEEQLERLRLLCTFAMVVGDPSRDSDRELIEAAYRIADHYRNQCAQGKEGT